MSKHTPGPWAVGETDTFGTRVQAAEAHLHPQSGHLGSRMYVHAQIAICREVTAGACEANAKLIAAAPDHALICKAMCVAEGRWEPWGDGRGEFCISGIRHATKLDEFGCPEVTPGMRTAIEKATWHKY